MVFRYSVDSCHVYPRDFRNFTPVDHIKLAPAPGTRIFTYAFKSHQNGLHCSDMALVISSFFYSFEWASYQIRKVVGCGCAGNVGNVFPHNRLQRKPLVSDPGMHHGTCVTHVPWCMSGSLTRRWRGKRSQHYRRMRTRNCTYLVRGPFHWSMFPRVHVRIS